MQWRTELWFSALLMGLAAGVASWGLVELDNHSLANTAWVHGGISFVSCTLLIFLLMRNDSRWLLTAGYAIVPALVVSLCAVWVFTFDPPGGRFMAFNLAMIITLYCALPFLQISHESGSFRFPYPRLFQQSWNNGFIVLVALVFCGLFWLLLLLWGGLFRLIDITFFRKLFGKSYFILPASYAITSVGIVLARDNTRVIQTLRRMTLSLIKSLMPILAFIALLFLVTLPLTGLTPLFATRSASTLLLWVVVLGVLFINGVFQDGELAAPYGRILRYGVQTFLVALPVYCGIALYAIGLRIAQHGLMPDRLYALSIAVVLSCYAVGYALAVFCTPQVWLGLIRQVNMGVAVVIIALALLLHSPLLDVSRVSVHNQMARLVSGKVAVADFDYGTLRFKLGRMGKEALDELLRQSSHPEFEAIRAQVERVKKAQSYWAWKKKNHLLDADAFARVFTMWPQGQVIAQAQRQIILNNLDWRDRETCQSPSDCMLLMVNLDEDNEHEYVLVHAKKRIRQLHVYDIQGTRGDVYTMQLPRNMWLSPTELTQAVEAGKIGTKPSPLQDMQIGERRFSFNK